MSTSKIVIVLLSHQGFWLGGQPGSISVYPALNAPFPKMMLQWHLMLDDLNLESGQLDLTGSNEASPAGLKLILPEVRVRTEFRWTYRILDQRDRKELSRGEHVIHVYPKDILSPLGQRLRRRSVVLIDHSTELSSVLREADVDHQRLEHVTQLNFRRDAIILVAPDQIGGDTFAQAPLLNLARGGSSVMLLEQPSAQMLAGYPVATRLSEGALEWRTNHPLLQTIPAEALQSLIMERKPNLIHPIRLPADEPALEIAFWASESDGAGPRPIEALVAVKAVGDGRMVLSQLPLRHWTSDPRSQLFLRSALDYLATPPEPTPPIGRRQSSRVVAVQPEPRITIPSGAQP